MGMKKVIKSQVKTAKQAVKKVKPSTKVEVKCIEKEIKHINKRELESIKKEVKRVVTDAKAAQAVCRNLLKFAETQEKLLMKAKSEIYKVGAVMEARELKKFNKEKTKSEIIADKSGEGTVKGRRDLEPIRVQANELLGKPVVPNDADFFAA